MIEPIKSSTPPTAMPIMRKGSNTNQTSGYKIRARRAMGQHKTNKMHHTRSFNIVCLWIGDAGADLE
jgi:hypothetical protein